MLLAIYGGGSGGVVVRKYPLYTALTVLLIVAEFGRAQVKAEIIKTLWEPPKIEWPTSGSGGSELHRLSLAGFPIRLDHTKLQNARRKLGGMAASSGDAGDWEGWLCYHGSDHAGRWVFWLTSDEINGDAIGGFIWKRVEPGESVDPRCKIITGPDPIRLQFPLRLGMTETSASVLGRPTSVRESELFYLDSHEETIKAERYTTDNGIEIKMRSGIVIQIAAFDISSD